MAVSAIRQYIRNSGSSLKYETALTLRRHKKPFSSSSMLSEFEVT